MIRSLWGTPDLTSRGPSLSTTSITLEPEDDEILRKPPPELILSPARPPHSSPAHGRMVDPQPEHSEVSRLRPRNHLARTIHVGTIPLSSHPVASSSAGGPTVEPPPNVLSCSLGRESSAIQGPRGQPSARRDGRTCPRFGQEIASKSHSNSHSDFFTYTISFSGSQLLVGGNLGYWRRAMRRLREAAITCADSAQFSYQTSVQDPCRVWRIYSAKLGRTAFNEAVSLKTLTFDVPRDSWRSVNKARWTDPPVRKHR